MEQKRRITIYGKKRNRKASWLKTHDRKTYDKTGDNGTRSELKKKAILARTSQGTFENNTNSTNEN